MHGYSSPAPPKDGAFFARETGLSPEFALLLQNSAQKPTRGHSQRLSEKLTPCSIIIAQKLRPGTHRPSAMHRFYTPMLRPKSPRRGIIEFLAHMPSDTMILITTAILRLRL